MATDRGDGLVGLARELIEQRIEELNDVERFLEKYGR
jgi:hypothetical protein